MLAALLVGEVVLATLAGTPVAAEPITLSIIDTGGDLASTQAIIENYKKANPDKVKEIRIQRAPAPELPNQDKSPTRCRPSRHKSHPDRTGRRLGNCRKQAGYQAVSRL
jgi:hypothetical protein